jgi:hypothetical protein
MCLSNTISGKLLWSISENILTSHQFAGQSRSAANLLRCSKRTIARNCPTASEGGSVQVSLGPLDTNQYSTNMAEEQFLALLGFEGRGKLAELPGLQFRDRDGPIFAENELIEIVPDNHVPLHYLGICGKS